MASKGFAKKLESGKGFEEKITAPYGSWKSPITADIVSAYEKRLECFALDAHGRLIWLESRPSESGRAVLVIEPDKPGDEPVDITPKEFSVRTTAVENGGRLFNVSGDLLVFPNFEDQRLYKQFISCQDSAPVPLTPDYGGPLVRYADGVFDPHANRYITVREDHCVNSLQPATGIVSVGLFEENIQEPKVLVCGNDFYALPCMGPTGEWLAWIEWSHPNMQWDKAELWVGHISENGDVYKCVCVCGGDSSVVESPSEPKWSARDRELYFITDRNNGFWNIYKWIEANGAVLSVYTMDAEFTRPMWNFGSRSYDFIQSNSKSNLLACSYRQNGTPHLSIIDEAQNSSSIVNIPFTHITNIITDGNFLYIEGASAIHPLSLARVTLDDHNSKAVDFEIIWSSSSDSNKFRSYFSSPKFIEFPTELAGQNAYAYLYPPCNPIYQADEEEKPPLLLQTHGGPTDEARGILNLGIRYWTGRGWAFVDVNYGGSSGPIENTFWGYGELLMLTIVVVVLNFCGKVDGKRLCITGCSAGGYTALASLAFRNTFAAGASLFGIADLISLRAQPEKFESHYTTNLVGNDDAFYERSPINFVDKFSGPVIIFQGLEDKVVYPEQSRKIYAALKEKGLAVALVEYEGEPHGFRKAETIKFTLEQQMVFFARTAGHFDVADEIIPIRIENFD